MNCSSKFFRKNHHYGVILFLMALIVTSACRKEFDYPVSQGLLEFSKDTVFLDTIFTNIGSGTYTLKVYNQTNEDIRIPSISLESGQDSYYRLNVDGLAGKEFEDIPLLAKDSMFIFVETTFDISSIGQNEFLYTDAIRFGSSSSEQRVELVTLVRDAIFLYPRTLANGMKETVALGLDDEGNEIRIEGFFLGDGDLNFTSEKPYVIYGYAVVPEDNTLTIDSGARVHFHKNSGLLVSTGASLQAVGALSADPEAMENEIIFEGDRLEPSFANEAGQWGTIWLREGSRDNLIDHVTIKNATVGILAEGLTGMAPTLSIRNSQIFNCSSINLWGKATSITAENLVLGNAGEASLYCNLGGSYDFIHSTIANYWSNGLRNGPALLIDNFIELQTGQQLAENLVLANFSNCIIGGNRQIELLLFENDGRTFNFNFTNCLIQFLDVNSIFTENPLYDFTDTERYQDILQNLDPYFALPFENNFLLLENSAAIDQGNPQFAQLVPLDLLGQDRTNEPDLGAYEFMPDQ